MTKTVYDSMLAPEDTIPFTGETPELWKDGYHPGVSHGTDTLPGAELLRSPWVVRALRHHDHRGPLGPLTTTLRPTIDHERRTQCWACGSPTSDYVGLPGSGPTCGRCVEGALELLRQVDDRRARQAGEATAIAAGPDEAA